MDIEKLLNALADIYFERGYVLEFEVRKKTDDSGVHTDSQETYLISPRSKNPLPL